MTYNLCVHASFTIMYLYSACDNHWNMEVVVYTVYSSLESFFQTDLAVHITLCIFISHARSVMILYCASTVYT